ncbi:MAG: hypothetical protein R2939_04075 [Kofleriaceae bacterium]
MSTAPEVGIHLDRRRGRPAAAAGDRTSHLDGGAPTYIRRRRPRWKYLDGVPGALAWRWTPRMLASGSRRR